MRPENIASISNLIQEQREDDRFKVEEREPLSMEYQCPAQPLSTDFYKQKIQMLERQVGELRQVTYWMKEQL